MSAIARVGDLYDPVFAEMSDREKIESLEGVADVIREETYNRPLTEEELLEKRERYVDRNIEIAEIQREIKDFTDLMKLDIKPKAKEVAELMGDLKTKTTTVKGKTFDVADQKNGVMVTYDEGGICIGVRSLKAKEKQRTIFSIEDRTTGTNER